MSFVNAKNFTPTKTQLNLLNRGLTFIPTVHIHKNFVKFQLEKDIPFHRRLSLIFYFKISCKKDNTLFVPKNNWTPPAHSMPQEVYNLIKDLETIKNIVKFDKKQTNLTSQELKVGITKKI